MHVLITGASRGLGLAFVRHYLNQGATVHAAARDPQAPALQRLLPDHAAALRLLPLDVQSDASVAALAAQVTDPLDLLINNAGVRERPVGLHDIDLTDAARLFDVNALGPLRVTRALLPQLQRGQGKQVAHLSSDLASIARNTSGGGYAYRMTKAALNMASRCLAHELRPLGILSVVLSPGWARTDMGGASAPLSAEESVAGLAQVLARLTLSDSGGFFHYTGAAIPW